MSLLVNLNDEICLFVGGCVVPGSWHGPWFQSGLNLQAITIDAESITTKGICLESHQDKFLFYDK